MCVGWLEFSFVTLFPPKAEDKKIIVIEGKMAYDDALRQNNI